MVDRSKPIKFHMQIAILRPLLGQIRFKGVGCAQLSSAQLSPAQPSSAQLSSALLGSGVRSDWACTKFALRNTESIDYHKHSSFQIIDSCSLGLSVNNHCASLTGNVAEKQATSSALPLPSPCPTYVLPRRIACPPLAFPFVP